MTRADAPSAGVPASICEHSINTTCKTGQHINYSLPLPTLTNSASIQKANKATRGGLSIPPLSPSPEPPSSPPPPCSPASPPLSWRGSVIRRDKLEVVAGFPAEKAVNRIQGIRKVVRCCPCRSSHRTMHSLPRPCFQPVHLHSPAPLFQVHLPEPATR